MYFSITVSSHRKSECAKVNKKMLITSNSERTYSWLPLKFQTQILGGFRRFCHHILGEQGQSPIQA